MSLHPIEAHARQAFAAGWATSGGPMTARVRAGCAAAVQLAVESADDPDVLAATVNLGKLEGMWARLFQRRDDLIALHAAAIGRAWQPLVEAPNIIAAVRQFRSRVGIAEGTDRNVKDEAAAAATAMLAGIGDQPGFADLRTALHDALAAGRAEGMVGAVAIAAERAHRDGLDWDAGFDAAYADVRRLQDLTADTSTWLRHLIERAATDLTTVLTGSANSGAGEKDTVTAASRTATSPQPTFVTFTTDWAMTTAAGVGVLDILRSEGVVYADWVTVGGPLVCVTCKGRERANPWLLEDFPAFPAHPNCRCIPEAAFSLHRYDSWFV